MKEEELEQGGGRIRKGRRKALDPKGLHSEALNLENLKQNLRSYGWSKLS